MLDVFYECNGPVTRRKEEIFNIEGEIQCMESCLAQGFTLQDYIESQKQLKDILEAINEAGRR